MLSNKERFYLVVFIFFTVVFELYHISIDTNPPTLLRVGYTAVYLLFAFISPVLIPTYTVINLIVERFSSSFGEYLPNTLLFHIIVLIFGILLIKGHHLKYEGCSYRRKTLYCFLVFLAYALICVFLHVDIKPDFSFIINSVFMLVFLCALDLLPSRYVKTIVVFSIYAMTIVCTIGLLNYENLVGEYSTSLGTVDRLEWKDANYFSFFIGLMLLLALFQLKYRIPYLKHKRVLLFVLIMLITMASLVSRGAIIALLISLLYYYRKGLFSIKSLGYLLLVMASLFILYYVGTFDSILTRFMSDDMQDGSGRLSIWETGLNTFLSKPTYTIIFGAGPGQDIRMTYLSGSYWSPHNNYLAILYCYGIVGLFIYLTWLVSLYRCGKSRETKAFILFVIVNSMTIVPFTYVSSLWWFIPIIMVWDSKVLSPSYI